MNRVATLSKHLTSASTTLTTGGEESVWGEAQIGGLENRIRTRAPGMILSELLPNPLDEPGMTIKKAVKAVAAYNLDGRTMLHFVDLAKRYGSDGIASNIVVPMVQSERPDPNGKVISFIDWLVVVANPEDAARLANRHTKKSVNYQNSFLRDGVLGTNDNGSWTEQRQHLIEAFLPNSSLKQIFPVSLRRAEFAVEKVLPDSSSSFSRPVEMNEFYLNEAMAQLQLTLLGETEEFMNSTNKPLRSAFSVLFDPEVSSKAVQRDKDAIRRTLEAREFVRAHSTELVHRAMSSTKHHGADASGDNKVWGPVAAKIADLCPAAGNREDIQRDVASTFFFAGHDTTANLMTWFSFEMARHPEIQRRVQGEVDALFEKLRKEGGRELTYPDLRELKFMTRCIAETLRMWPSVPNGTFRELECDETIVGRNGRKVTIPKGTQVMIPVWNLHLNEKLWGPDVNTFNPDRDFLPEEIFFNQGLMTYNPTSHRYAPFTFQPRGCMGQPFASMEARVILANVMRKYNLTLAEPTLSAEPGARNPETFIAANNGTMAPKSGIYLNVIPRGRNSA